MSSFTTTKTIDARSTVIVDLSPLGTNLDFARIDVVAEGDATSWAWIETTRIDKTGAYLYNGSTFSKTVTMTIYHQERAQPAQVDVVADSLDPIPDEFWTDAAYRLYVHQAGGFWMTNLTSVEPAMRDYYINGSLEAIVENMDAGNLTLLQTAITKARALSPPMLVYPAGRLLTTSVPNFATVMTRSYWEGQATEWAKIIALRVSGCPLIGVDAEMYPAALLEISQSAIEDAGGTLAQFYTAFEPITDLFVLHGLVPCTYPAIALDDDPLHVPAINRAFLEVLGTERCVQVWEDMFNLPQDYRLNIRTMYERVAAQKRRELDFETATGFSHQIHQPMVDDDWFRRWGRVMRDHPAYAGIAPRLFDRTRSDKASTGLQAFVNGTTIKSANDVYFNWVAAPLSFGGSDATGTIGFSTGIAPTAIILDNLAGNATSAAASPNSFLITSTLGVIFNEPPTAPTLAYTLLEGVDALPALTTDPFMVDITIQIPAAIAADVPLFGACRTNLATWQVVYLQATNEIVLQLNHSGGPGVQQIQAAPARDTDIRIQVGRGGTLAWLVAVGSGVPVRFNAGASVAVGRNFRIGSGLNPTTFPATNAGTGCKNMILRAGVNIWWDLPTDSEINTQIQGNTYPFGRGST